MSIYLERGRYWLTSEKDALDIGAIHAFLTESYWSKGIALELVEKSIDHSICVGLFHGDEQVGFARVFTDFTSFAYLADVFVLESHRGKGLARWMLEASLAHPDLRYVRRWLLATRDAHDLYAKLGFKPLATPERYMEIHRPLVAQEMVRVPINAATL